MPDKLAKIFAALGGGVVLLYVFGFTVVQSYIYKNGIEGMFWLTNEFYADAGAKFLLEMIRAPLLAPHISMPFLFALFLLVPKPDYLKKSNKDKATFADLQKLKLVILFFLMFAIYLFALFFGEILESKKILNIVNYLFLNPIGDPSPTIKQSLLFFSVVAPMVFTLALFLFRFYGSLKLGSQIRITYQLVIMLYAIFLVAIPVAYGLYIYDWKIVPIKETHKVGVFFSENVKADTSSLRVWLLGEFGDKYVFFKKEKLGAQGVIEAFDVDEIKRLNFDPRRADSLRQQMEGRVQKAFLKGAQETLNQSVK